MTFAQKLLMIIGIIFTSVGAFILALTLGLNLFLHEGAFFMILPIAFLTIGLGFIIGVFSIFVHQLLNGAQSWYIRWGIHRCSEKVKHPETRKPLSGKNLRLCTTYFIFSK